MADLRFVVAGLLVGSLVGFSGMGGGSLMTPLLIAFGVPAPTAIGSDLAYSAITKSVGTLGHARRGQVDWRIAIWLAVGSVPASLLGVATLVWIRQPGGEGGNNLVEHLLGGMLIVAGASIVYRLLRRPSACSGEPASYVMTRRAKVLATAVGAAGGYAVGLTSVGSGTLFAIVLMSCFPLAARRVVGTDLCHATLLVWAAGAAQALAGNVHFATVGALLVGAVPGV